MPVTMMLKPKLLMAPALDDAVRVKVASADAPGSKVVPALFQASVRYELPFAGDQFAVAMLSLIGIEPVFFT